MRTFPLPVIPLTEAATPVKMAPGVVMEKELAPVGATVNGNTKLMLFAVFEEIRWYSPLPGPLVMVTNLPRRSFVVQVAPET
jgi:hypothetical protein